VPDRWGRLGDVVLGFKTVGEYEAKSPYFGGLIGRYADRIAGGKFELDGNEYTLNLNNGTNTLHGGKKGYDKVVWAVKPLDGASAEFSYLNPDGEKGCPGNLNVKVIYTWTNDNELKIAYEAMTDKPTVINLTSHSYFNLAGEGSGTIENQILTVNADHYTPVDGGGIPTGEISKVEARPSIFASACRLAREFIRGLNRWSMAEAMTTTSSSTTRMAMASHSTSASMIRALADC
jgi:aldose 1-epimerase